MINQSKSKRREFIRNSLTVAAALTVVPRHVLGGRGFTAPSDQVVVGIAGAGGQSMFSIRQLIGMEDVRLTAVADPALLWKNDILYSADSGRGPTKKFIENYYKERAVNQRISEYEDFRVMLDREKSLDAVVCATPDNTHAWVSVLAMRAGKHVYCEKPLTHNIWEARKLRDVARETGLATQMGNQGHSHDEIRQTVEWLRAGAIGTVREAHTWVSATRWLPELKGFPQGESPLPDGFKWDLWLGPTEWHPYNKVYTPVKWRDFWAFGCGALGDFGCHDMDSTTWAFNLQSPDSVEVMPAGNKGSQIIAPFGEIGYFRFKEEGEQPSFKLTWYSGGLHPELPDVVPGHVKLSSRGALFIGDKGVILNNGGSGSVPDIYPESLRASFTPPAPSIPRVHKAHHREWIDDIKGGPASLSNFEYAARLTEIVLLGVLSLRLGGKKIFWDGKEMKVKGLPEADAMIREPVRSGWEFE